MTRGVRRLSVDKSDPGYSADIVRYQPYLNGFRSKWVVTADEEQGYALLYATDDAGRAVIDPNTRRVVTEEFHGLVRLKRLSS
jgi:hypothetical protein